MPKKVVKCPGLGVAWGRGMGDGCVARTAEKNEKSGGGGGGGGVRKGLALAPCRQLSVGIARHRTLFVPNSVRWFLIVS